MPAPVVPTRAELVFGLAKYLARDYGEPTEGWRVPIVSSYATSAEEAVSATHDAVTFVLRLPNATDETRVEVVGTFHALYEPVPLVRLERHGKKTSYFAVTVLVPRSQVCRYRFLVDGKPTLDPVNPQTTVLDNGAVWSQFFTQYCAFPMALENWEYGLLGCFTDHILPFRTADGERFLNQFYYAVSKEDRDQRVPGAYRLDRSVGAANFIDHLLAREERFLLPDYRACLAQIARILTQRFPGRPVEKAPLGAIAELYDQMATGHVPGWDYSLYSNPRYFLALLRRHAITGAFSHPRYGGNAGAAGWRWLEDRYRDENGDTLFNWRLALEPPFGLNGDYRG